MKMKISTFQTEYRLYFVLSYTLEEHPYNKLSGFILDIITLITMITSAQMLTELKKKVKRIKKMSFILNASKVRYLICVCDPLKII